MNALVLAGGYGTRLGALTLNTPKPLLEVAGRPMLTRIVEKLIPVKSMTGLVVVTNAKFADHFGKWAYGNKYTFPVNILNDGTTANDNRLGAVGDIQFAIEKAGLENDDLMILGGDNLYSFDLNAFVEFAKAKGDAGVMYDVGSLDLAKLYGVAALDADAKVVDFAEKPAQPKSTLASTCLYYFQKKNVPLFKKYLASGHDKDKTGSFIAWVYKQIPFYGWTTGGQWIDIGSPQELDRANKELAGT
jgi:glucose-1-phosphate thymidylyltransferase